MIRQQLRSIGHSAAVRLFQQYPEGDISLGEIRRELIASAKEPRNFGMTDKHFKLCLEKFIPRELGRLSRRKQRAVAEQAQQQGMQTS
jgi:hypothetical protein